MEKAQYAILRFAKYKGPEIGRIEAHDERTKEKYASNRPFTLREKVSSSTVAFAHNSLEIECKKKSVK